MVSHTQPADDVKCVNVMTRPDFTGFLVLLRQRSILLLLLETESGEKASVTSVRPQLVLVKCV